MKSLPARLLASSLLVISLPVLADDTVTIPKSRLEELQRKEAELDKLRGDLGKTKSDLNKAKDENVELKKQREQDAAKIANSPAPVVIHESPPMASLTPLAKGEVVDAMDLANHYRADSAAADQRYRKHSFQVQGEVVAFEKAIVIKPYNVLLKTADRELKVVCSVQPPEKYSAVFTTKHGAEMVGLLPHHTEEPFLKLGDTVVVSGECRGLSDSRVVMGRCELKSVKRGP
jgi:hypothetical protein